MKKTLSQLSFIQRKFQEYYLKGKVPMPSRFEEREFGFLLFSEGMVRHKGFENSKDLQRFLCEFTPSDVYYSCAFYEHPEAPMDEKGWLGADLIFDIDADHISTPCRKMHDVWICGGCGFGGKGAAPERCPHCKGERFKVKAWACEVCLESAKAEVLKLLDMLFEDFGFSEGEVRVFFSGHRGYHVHVESEAVWSLGSAARKEIVDYVLGLGLDAKFHGLENLKGYGIARVVGPSLEDFGWRGRLARGVYEIILDASERKLESLGLSRRVAKLLLKNRDKILESWNMEGPWGIIRGVGLESWKKLVAGSINLQSAKVDTVVTTDVHRLIRLENTLHGKTGFKKTRVDLSHIEEFDPFREGIAFRKGTVKVFVTESPKIKIGDELFGPLRDEWVELPTAVAVLLLCKGVARVADENV
jgi:DNA primase small subunit